MRRLAPLVLAAVLPSLPAAQLSVPGEPAGGALPGDVPTVHVTPPDVAALRAEDHFREEHGVLGPLRFGVPVPVAVDLERDGRWDVADDGALVWRVRIESVGAKSLGLEFDAYDLPAGGQVFLYDDAMDTVFGAFDASQHQPDGSFVIAPFPGEAAVLEYRQPAGVGEVAALRLDAVVHDYRDVFELERRLDAHALTSGEGGITGGCTVGANCAAGAPYGNLKRATVRTVSGGGLCSASLINNSASDGTQYVYTAHHCNQGSTTVFRFKYEQPGCESGGAPTNMEVSGATVLLSHSNSDGRLLRINTPIPASYEPYFQGWNRTSSNPSFCVSMTHPGGNPKAVSIDANGAGKQTISPLGGSGPVQTWSLGFGTGGISGGSSGGPLADGGGRTIGTATAGNLFICSSANYGRFHVFWEATALSQILDPTGSGAIQIDGYDPVGGPPPPCGATSYGTNLGPANIASLSTNDTPSAGQPFTVDLSGFDGSGTAILAVGLLQLDQPFGTDGTVLTALSSAVAQVNVAISGGSGSTTFPSLPAGATAYLQAAMADASFSNGWALSDGLQVVVCP